MRDFEFSVTEAVDSAQMARSFDEAFPGLPPNRVRAFSLTTQATSSSPLRFLDWSLQKLQPDTPGFGCNPILDHS